MMQFAANTIIAGSNIALLAIAFQLMYRTRRAFDFSFSALYLIAPYCVLWLNRSVGLPFFQAVTLGFAIVLVLAYALEKTLYQQLRHREASALVVMLASFGLFIVTENTIAILFGPQARTLRDWESGDPLELAGARFSLLQAISVFCMLLGLLGTVTFQQFTRIGRLLRAVSCNQELAVAIGIPVDWVIMVGYLASAVLISLAAVTVGLDTDITPSMGFPVFLAAVTACMVGGITNIGGVLAGSAAIAFAQQTSIWILGGRWAEGTTYALLFGVLSIRRTSVIAGPAVRYGA